MSDRIIVITGAGQGVGQGIALAFAAEGDTVVLAGRTVSKLEETRRLIDERGQGRALVVECNVKSAVSLNELVQHTVAAFGGIDILVNNAQEVPKGELLAVEDAAFVAGFESGPLAALRLMKLAHPIMVARGGGVIINLVSSVIERWDMTGYGAYAATKSAIQSLTRGAAAEWGNDNIRVLNIAPHAESPGLKSWAANNPAEASAFFKTIPLGRIGQCEADIGRAVVCLCSADMGYLTGATIPLDGGQANFD